MSADNWSNCPNCLKKRKLKKQTHEGLLQQFYGKVSAEEYLEMSRNPKHPKFKNAVPVFEEDTYEEGSLREDYCQGVDDDGVYSVEYHCSCGNCGFQWSYKHTVDDVTSAVQVGERKTGRR